MPTCVECRVESDDVKDGFCKSPLKCLERTKDMEAKRDRDEFHRSVIVSAIGHMSASPMLIGQAASVVIARAIALADEATQTVFGSVPERKGASPKESHNAS